MYPPKHYMIDPISSGESRNSDGDNVNVNVKANTNAKAGNHSEINQQLSSLIEDNPLATLVFNNTLAGETNTEKQLHISHVPCHFMIKQDPNSSSQSTILIAHISNIHPLAGRLKSMSSNESNGKKPININLIFHGEEAYISPNDVAVDDRVSHKVPTWNYSKVHVSASVYEVVNPSEKYRLMEQSTDYFERSSDQPWLLKDVSNKAIEKMLKAITFIKMSIIDIEGSFKLSQNKPKRIVEQITNKLARNNKGELAKQMLRQQG